jgi:tryptophanyl-tRNA synthetase
VSRIVSGIRPTGHPQLGNYFGALKQWVDVAKKTDETFFCIVDQHALTTLKDLHTLKQDTLIMAATYIACGIDPVKNAIFVQSHVPCHTELAWYLTCMTPMGWLSRMTQFKDKAGKKRENALTGLFTYPVLMAADIVLYGATHVPVGDDQKQHVEFARDIVQVFNNMAGSDILKMPEPVIQKSGARIKSLRDGLKKMSKSDVSDYARINLNDEDDLIALKIKKAKTDPAVITGDITLLENRPELENLITLHALLEDKPIQIVLNSFDGKNFSDLKISLTDLLIAHLSPIREKVNALLNDQAYLNKCLKDGADRANNVANHTMQRVKSCLNLLQL